MRFVHAGHDGSRLWMAWFFCFVLFCFVLFCFVLFCFFPPWDIWQYLGMFLMAMIGGDSVMHSELLEAGYTAE